MEKSKFYIYVYLDPRKPGDFQYGEYLFDYEPIYVGFGSRKDRKFFHLEKAKNPLSQGQSNPYKINKIRKILKKGKEPIIRAYFQDLSLKEANFFETDMIATIGRKTEGGPLTNHKEGGCSNRGYHHTDEARKKIGEYWRGRKLTEKHIENIRKSKLGSKNPMYGKKFSKEHLENLSKAQKEKWARWRIRNGKELKETTKKPKIKCILFDPQGNKHEVFHIVNFCTENNLNNVCVSGLINGNRKEYKGWKGYKIK